MGLSLRVGGGGLKICKIRVFFTILYEQVHGNGSRPTIVCNGDSLTIGV